MCPLKMKKKKCVLFSLRRCCPFFRKYGLLYDLFFNAFFYFILLATVNNFADDNNLICFGKTIHELLESLESECEADLN